MRTGGSAAAGPPLAPSAQPHTRQASLLSPYAGAEGRLQLTAVDAQPGCSGDEVLALAAAAERNTRHPLADALVAAAESRGEQQGGQREGGGGAAQGECSVCAGGVGRRAPAFF